MGAPDLSLRLKFSEIVLYKFTLALVDFVFTFSIYSYFHVIFVNHSQFLRYILKKKQRNFVAYA